MLGQTFYHASITKLITALGTVFNNIHIRRFDGGTCTTTLNDNTITSTSGEFASTDVGKTIIIKFAGAERETFETTIASFTSTTSVELADAPQNTLSNTHFQIIDSTIKVPLAYAPKQKFMRRLDEQASLENKKLQTTLPRMSFEMTNMQYDPTRKLNSIQKYVEVIQSDPNSGNVRYQYQRVPYSFTFSVYAYVKNLEDGYQILEQITPMFTPDFVVNIRDTEDMNIVTDVPFILDGVTQDDQFDGNFEEIRMTIFTFNITAKGYFYGPTKTGGVIQTAIINFYDGNFTNGGLSDARRTSRITQEAMSITFTTTPEFELGEDIFLFRNKNGDLISDTLELSPRTAIVKELNTESSSSSVAHTVTVKTNHKFYPGETIKGNSSGATAIVSEFNDPLTIEIFNDALSYDAETGDDI